ncbi:MAG: PTS glucose transporter subunit IIA [Coprococcus sp.]|nr:PTS glucose transporter subunit IIA [Coprococcus sp.]
MWNNFFLSLMNNWWLYAVLLVCAGGIVYMWVYYERKSRRAALSKEEKADVDETRKLASIVSGLGGVDNIYDFDSCATRLRVVVNDGRLVDRGLLRTTGATGILGKDRGVQIIYGQGAKKIKKELEMYVDKIKETDNDSAEEILISDERIIERIYTPVEGDIVYLADIHGYEALGDENRDGIAVFPKRGEVRAPFDGEIRAVQKERNQLVITSLKGINLLIHIGRGLEQLQGEGFRLHVREGNFVRKGSLLLEFDLDMFASRGYETTAYIILLGLNGNYGYKAYIRENVNYEHVAMTVFADTEDCPAE